jgi:glycosyltransferase involved in cell wall biosynthesis|tara:strand:- start:2857 stop:3696 length:840 start_codon:yes stop_codon:yes gene_type:complete
MSNQVIQILLATYNGSNYIREQLDSLLSQTNKNWLLLIHDDGSTDSTMEIIKVYCNIHPERIFLLEDDIHFGNSKDNFSHLLAASTAEYVMFCDQDDIWLSDKIEKTFGLMQDLVNDNKELPILVHSDLEVVDESLSSIAPSMFAYQGLSKSINGLLQILVKNSVTGCTMMINRKAIQVSLPMSSSAIMHDWWIAANVIKHHGIVGFVDKPLIQYRQHGSNSVGAKKNTLYQLVFRCVSYASHSEVRDKVYIQAKSIYPKLKKFYFFREKIKMAVKSFF